MPVGHVFGFHAVHSVSVASSVTRCASPLLGGVAGLLVGDGLVLAVFLCGLCIPIYVVTFSSTVFVASLKCGVMGVWRCRETPGVTKKLCVDGVH